MILMYATFTPMLVARTIIYLLDFLSLRVMHCEVEIGKSQKYSFNILPTSQHLQHYVKKAILIQLVVTYLSPLQS